MGKHSDNSSQAAQHQSDADVPSTATLLVPASSSYLSLIGAMVKWFGRPAGLSEEQTSELEVAVDEACTNVIRYAFPNGAKGEITVVCSPIANGLLVRILDQGKPFDPRQGDEIAMAKRLQDPASGGLGLSLIRQLVDDVQYQWDKREGNQLVLIKHKNEK
ncbi:MAG: ATP-binding protein [Chloroflexi bacterium]|nr:ATP-binding protein [Chloroflexota bacterium]